MSRRPDQLAVGLAALLMSAACAPQSSVSYVTTEKPVDLVYGQQATPTLPPRALTTPTPPLFPGFLLPASPLQTPPTVTPTVAPPTPTPTPTPSCPPAAAGAVAAPPPTTAKGAPAPGTYTSRRTGFVSTGKGSRTSLSGTVTVTYSKPATADPVPTDTSWTWTETQIIGSQVTKTTYLAEFGGDLPGLKIVEIDTDGASFRPQPPVRIANFPFGTEQAATSDYGVDPLTSEVMEVDHTTNSPTRINACGTLLSGWDVTATGKLTNPNTGQNLVLTAEYVIAPQYGMMIVSSDVDLKGTPGSSGGTAALADKGTYEQHTSSTINSVPAPAVSP